MRQALVIARRELAEKRFVALAALAFAVLPFLLASIPMIRGHGTAADAIATGAGLIAVGFTGGLALILGGTIIGRDLSENRLSFYFARPVGAASIWFGKIAAAVALIVGAFLIIVGPAMLFAAPGWQRSWGATQSLDLTTIVIGGSLLLFFLAHVVGSFVRSRSAWLAVDFAALCVVAGAVALIVRPLRGLPAPQVMTLITAILGVGLAAGLIGGGAWQLARGRTDRKRSHVALSQFLWAAIGGAVAVAALAMTWIASAKPSDLVTMGGATAREPWIVIGGKTRGHLDYPAAFVYNADTGAYSRFSARLINMLIFTRDGSSLIYSRRDFEIESGSKVDPRTRSVEVFRRPIDRDAEEFTGLTLPFFSRFAANDDGSRLVTEAGGILSVYDIPQRRSVIAARLPENAGSVVAMYFASPSLARVIALSPGAPSRTLRVFELDLRARALRMTGEVTREAKYLVPIANADGSRLVLASPETMYIADGRTAAIQATIPRGEVGGVTWLSDGTLAVCRGTRIDFIDPNGTVRRSLNVPLGERWGLREAPNGQLITRVHLGVNWHTYIIDAASGAIVHDIPGTPAGWPYENMLAGGDPRRGPMDLPKYYVDGTRLFRWNYATKQAEVLLPKS